MCALFFIHRREKKGHILSYAHRLKSRCGYVFTIPLFLLHYSLPLYSDLAGPEKILVTTTNFDPLFNRKNEESECGKRVILYTQIFCVYCIRVDFAIIFDRESNSLHSVLWYDVSLFYLFKTLMLSLIQFNHHFYFKSKSSL